MSTRRKFVIALNVIAICIASLSYAVHRASLTKISVSIYSVEMQLVAIPTMTDVRHKECGLSCVITSRAALGIAH